MFQIVRPPPSFRLKPPAPPRHHLGLAISLVLHGVVIGLLVAGGQQLLSRPTGPGLFGNLTGDGGSGGGGSRVAYITLPSPPESPPPAAKRAPVPRPQPVVLPPPRPAPPATPPEPVTPAVDTAVSPSTGELATGDSTRGTSEGSGAGSSTGAGPGEGPGTGGAGFGPGGGGGRAHPPEPRDMAFPFDNPPKELRGMSLNVTFWVRVDGKVERYVVEPEIKDRDYARKFDEVMRAFRFTPARAPDGTRVPGTARISFTLPGKSSS